MKRGEDLISNTTFPNAVVSAVSNDGRPGPLEALRNLEKSDGKYRKIIRIIADVDTLLYAYSLIKSNPGNMTPGTDTETLDGLGRE